MVRAQLEKCRCRLFPSALFKEIAMRLNTRPSYARQTAEGGAAFPHLTPIQQLRRTVLACLLWEDTFYEDGQSVADRISEAAEKVSVRELAALAVEARKSHNLRHVPLLLLAVLCRRASGSSLVSETIYNVISRADELSEFVAVYAQMNGVTPDKVKKKLSAQAKKGLARAFSKFDAYQLGKYNRDGAVKLRDVLFLTHPKAVGEEQALLWKLLAENNLPSPDTWEVELSAGKDKKETFERLIREGKLGYLALLRNLRNMAEAKVEVSFITSALANGKGKEKVLPFRYIAAARAAPQFEPFLDDAMQDSIKALPVLSGNTVIVVDVSGSMDEKLSQKSDLKRMDAAAALASIVNAEHLRVFTFSNGLVEVPPRRGMSGIDAIRNSQPHGSTQLALALDALHKHVTYDRIIVITDEQTRDGIVDPRGKGYLINVGTDKNGVGYGKWTHVDGFSENVLKFIHETEIQATEKEKAL